MTPSAHATPAAAAGPGRPRDADLDTAIIQVTRERLAEQGYSQISLSEIAAAAGTTRPTLYRRWPTKLDLVIAALEWGFQAQTDSYPSDAIAELEPREAFVEAVRRLDPAYFNEDAMLLMGNFMGEARRTPELLAIVRERAVNPRLAQLEAVLQALQHGGGIRPEVDVRAVATLCFGAYFATFLREDADHHAVAESVCDTLWPSLAP
ncbi:TetR/AcrR family transcriptional regulator [Nocardioides sp. QY071]|uniref:TetR/AcrR family transcriptional regulator n=1 Tax=Nocardioides sp. QY071 TaxID=3044187 RepID=UPI00249B8C3E